MSEHLIPSEIVIHASESNDGPTVQWTGTREWHMGTPPNGPADGPYLDIAYHAGVELVNNHYEILMGRMWDFHGAHCKGHNGLKGQPFALGLVLIGRFMSSPPPETQLAMAAKLTKFWMLTWNIPLAKVYRHKELNDTDCPGDMFPWDKFKSLLA